jgi:hypothetical protein
MGHGSRIGCGQNTLSSGRAFPVKCNLLNDMVANVQAFKPKLRLLHENIS